MKDPDVPRVPKTDKCPKCSSSNIVDRYYKPHEYIVNSTVCGDCEFAFNDGTDHNGDESQIDMSKVEMFKKYLRDYQARYE